MNHPIYGTYTNFMEHFLGPCMNYIANADYLLIRDSFRSHNVMDHILKDPFIPYDHPIKIDFTEHHLKLMRHPLFLIYYALNVANNYVTHEKFIVEKTFKSNKIIQNISNRNVLTFYNNKWYLCESEKLLLYHMLTQC